MVHNETFMWAGTVNPFLLCILGMLSLLISFMPAFIAFSRHHPSRVGILILNILFGWTGIGWIILLIWALDRPAPLNHEPIPR